MAGKAVPKKRESSRANPISGSEKKEKPVKEKTEKDPKASHLFTDDNPATTLPGTGFKDAETADRTISLVSKRALLYQWQTINTMYNRAKHHPNKTKDMEAAMAVFNKWLKETYPEEKAAQRVFKPLLSKKVMELFLPDLKKASDIDTTFAELYVTLEPRKKLANVLVDATKPKEADWDKARVDALSNLVPDENNKINDDELWDKDGVPSKYHSSLIALAWTPLSEYKLLKATNKGPK